MYARIYKDILLTSGTGRNYRIHDSVASTEIRLLGSHIHCARCDCEECPIYKDI